MPRLEKLRINLQDDYKSKFEEESYFKNIRKPVMQATTIHPEIYRSEECYRVESSNVFEKSWQTVGYLSDLKQHGDVVVTSAANQPILITRDKDNEIRGFFNTCRHRGARLLSKNGRYPVISCPYHRWGYALDGRLLATPMWKGDGVCQHEKGLPDAVKKAFSTDQVQNFNKKDFGLLPVRTAIWGPYVYANVSGDAPPLETYLGDVTQVLQEYPWDQLVSVKTARYEAKANWKLLAENFMEYYHLPAVHPELCDVSGMDDHHRAQGHGSYIGFATSPLTRGGTPIDVDKLPTMEGLSGKNKETAWFYYIFPNAFYFLFPHGFFSVIMEPTGPETTTEHANFMVHPNAFKIPDAEKLINEMWDFYILTNDQDINICQEVQLGIQAKAYKGGRVTFRFEETVHRFQNMIADYMTKNPQIPRGDQSPPFAFQKTFS